MCKNMHQINWDVDTVAFKLIGNLHESCTEYRIRGSVALGLEISLELKLALSGPNRTPAPAWETNLFGAGWTWSEFGRRRLIMNRKSMHWQAWGTSKSIDQKRSESNIDMVRTSQCPPLLYLVVNGSIWISFRFSAILLHSLVVEELLSSGCREGLMWFVSVTNCVDVRFNNLRPWILQE